MPNKQQNPILSVLNALLVLAGILSLIVGTQEALQATLLLRTGQGAIAGQSAPSGEQLLTQEISLHPAAAVVPNMGPMLALGMLLILLGCTLHALFVLRNQKPEAVGLKRKIDGKDLHPILQYLEIFWIDRRK
ncbi:MAG TPA: hypothetical protein VJB10_03740 [Candidatus Peribacteraceae bacterium]|nr:hypothetical protein [Candidatus Peribacteraceae bacterium]